MVEFIENFCDKIREVLLLVNEFEKGNKINDNYLFSIPYDNDIDDMTKKAILTLCEEICEAKILKMEPYIIILQIRKIYLIIDYGINNNKILRYDFFLSMSKRKPLK